MLLERSVGWSLGYMGGRGGARDRGLTRTGGGVAGAVLTQGPGAGGTAGGGGAEAGAGLPGLAAGS